MIIKLIKKKNKIIKTLRLILKSVRLELKQANKKHDKEIGRLIAKQMRWEALSNELVELKLSMVEKLEKIRLTNNELKNKVGVMEHNRHEAERAIVKIDKNIEIGKRNIQ